MQDKETENFLTSEDKICAKTDQKSGSETRKIEKSFTKPIRKI